MHRPDVIFGERHLRAVLTEYTAHYNQHRPHRSLDLRAPADGADVIRLPVGRTEHRQVLGGLINQYERAGWPRTRPATKPQVNTHGRVLTPFKITPFTVGVTRQGIRLRHHSEG
jgi:hypothetical protein